jgi:hypothetical protein
MTASHAGAANRYLEHAVDTATPARLISMLYEAALQRLAAIQASSEASPPGASTPELSLLLTRNWVMTASPPHAHKRPWLLT